jgi:glycine/D-amino acid oxidase-like deaminating enzyme
MNIPDSVEYCIVGAGVHGLSTALHLARKLKEKKRGDGSRIILIDKTGPGAGASGIACGIVRNFYVSQDMTELVKLSVEVWEEDPEAFTFNAAGYVAAVPKEQVKDLEGIHRRQKEVGYNSDFFVGEPECGRHMRTLWSDFHCEGIEAVLHEKVSGFTIPKKAVATLVAKAEAEGVRILRGVEVTGFDTQGNTVTTVRTSRGDIRAELIVIGAGPWGGRLWKMLGLPMTAKVRAADGTVSERPMFTYWQLREGSVVTEKPFLQDDGRVGPVIHLDHTIPLVDPTTGQSVDPGPWGIYWKKDPTGVQGGGVPLFLGTEAEFEPYGRANQTLDAGFQEYFRAGLAWAMDRFRRSDHRVDVERPNGGIGCFTLDNHPIIDMVRSNVYFVADSNHGYKMLGVGKEIAAHIAEGTPRRVLQPFRLARFDEGHLHRRSQSPFPWT